MASSNQGFPQINIESCNGAGLLEAISIARRIIKNCGLHNSYRQMVDTSQLVEGLDVQFLEAVPASTWGFVLNTPQRVTLAINETLDTKLSRFVMAHELGHLAMSHPERLNTCLNDVECDQVEAEATTIAAYLLVPRLALVADGIFGGMAVGELAKRLVVPIELVEIRTELYWQTGY